MTLRILLRKEVGINPPKKDYIRAIIGEKCVILTVRGKGGQIRTGMFGCLITVWTVVRDGWFNTQMEDITTFIQMEKLVIILVKWLSTGVL